MNMFEPNREFPLLGDIPMLPVQEAELVRDLVMTEVRERARRVAIARDKRAHRFVLYDNSGGEVGSDLVDTFLSVSVSKKGPRWQSMRISFLELILSDERRLSNYREIYAFDWFEGRVMAQKRNIELIGGIAIDGFNENGEPIVKPYSEKVVATLPIEPADCDELCSRMLTVAVNADSNRAA